MSVHHVGMISNCSIKTVVVVDRPVKALTCKKLRNIDKVLIAVILSKIIFPNKISSCKCPRGVHHVGMISNCSIKNCGRS